MNPTFTRAARLVLRGLPKSRLAYRCARAYMNWYRGENNHIQSSNGEAWAMDLLLPHCRIAFDVGANVGDWTEIALRANPSLEVHCFEPASTTFATLERRGFKGAKLNRAALSDHDGDAKLHLYGDVSAINSLVCDQTNTYGVLSGSERVPTMTFDRYVRDRHLTRVDYVKLDVEGSERLVLAGMEQSLRKGVVDLVQFEYGRFSIFGRVFLLDMFRFFHERGFSLFKLVQNAAHHYGEYRDELESFEYQNWIAVRNGSPMEGIVRGASVPGHLVK